MCIYIHTYEYIHIYMCIYVFSTCERFTDLYTQDDGAMHLATDSEKCHMSDYVSTVAGLSAGRSQNVT